MEGIEALRIVESLAHGVDPHTGEVFQTSSPYQNPQTIRALFLALSALEKQEAKRRRVRNLPVNAGKPWTDEEEKRLIRAYDAKKSLGNLAREHGRTEFAITSRLEKLGKIESTIRT